MWRHASGGEKLLKLLQAMVGVVALLVVAAAVAAAAVVGLALCVLA